MPSYPTTAVLANFREVQHGGTRVLVRRAWEPWVGALVAAGDGGPVGEAENRSGDRPVAEVDAWVRGGRAAHPRLRLANGERVLVRAFRRGGAFRHLNSRFYLQGNRAYDELRATERAAASGVRTATVVAAGMRRVGPVYTAWIATRWIDGVRDAAALLASAEGDQPLRALREAGRQISRMHAAGVAHPDLNLRNLLVATGDGDVAPAVYLLDFDRARLYPAGVHAARRARDLRRLARSARKLAAPLGVGGWRALRDGYGEDWPPGAPRG